jgi:hypothetical protein
MLSITRPSDNSTAVVSFGLMISAVPVAATSPAFHVLPPSSL